MEKHLERTEIEITSKLKGPSCLSICMVTWFVVAFRNRVSTVSQIYLGR